MIAQQPKHLQQEVKNSSIFLHSRHSLKKSKGKINCIKNLREILLANEEDTAEVVYFKAAFQIHECCLL